MTGALLAPVGRWPLLAEGLPALAVRWPLVAGGLLALAVVGWLHSGEALVWRLRYRYSRVAVRLPQRLVPTPLRVLPPSEREYLGVWNCPPAEARRRLREEHGFTQTIRAYLHAYERDGESTFEVASCSRREEGVFDPWQLHVRLFPRPDGRTDVWCHWERNPNVSPIAHLRKDGFSAAEGKRRFRRLVDDPDALATDSGEVRAVGSRGS